MRAWLSHAPGGPETLTLDEIETPPPGDDEVLIAVHACGLNFPDLLMLANSYQVGAARPFAPGSETAGVVLAAGCAVKGFRTGDRVAGLSDTGGLAETAAIQSRHLFHLPPSVSFETAAATLFTYGTAFYSLRCRGQIEVGSQLLVLGAGGAIGIAMTEIGRAFGAEVTAAASDLTKLALASAKGATRLILYPRDLAPDSRATFVQALREASGRTGFDLVADPVGGDYSLAAIEALAWNGRYLIIGFAAGIPRMPADLLVRQSSTLVGVDWYQYGLRDPAGRAEDVEQLFDMVATGALNPTPSEVLPFKSAPEGLARIARRAAGGKLVVSIAG